MASPIIQKTFKGRIPRVSAKLLPESFAQIATNCDLRRGSLAPVKGFGSSVGSGSSTIFKMGSTWASWGAGVNAVKAQIANSGNRTYLTGRGSYPEQTNESLYGSGIYKKLGIDAPENTLNVAFKGTPSHGTLDVGTITGCTTTAGSEIVTCPEAHGLTLQVGDFVALSGASGEADDGDYTIASFTGSDEANGSVSLNTTLTSTSTNVTLTITRQKDAGIQASVSYVFTKVQTWPDGSVEESAPSPPTSVIDVYEGQGITLTGFDTWALDGYLTQTYRIYRLLSGTSGGEFCYLADIERAAGEYEDYILDGDEDDSPYGLRDVGTDILETDDWIPPPDGLQGLTQFGNGILIGFVGNKLYVSEPFVAYAWPDAYTLTFDYDIVALGVHNESIIVLTEAYPYIVTGLDPESFSQTILPYEQACVNATGMAVTNIGVLYPCPDGLFLINGTAGKLITKDIYTKEQWAALGPENLISFFYDDQYYGFFSGTGTGIAFNFKVDPYVVDLEVGSSITGGFLHAEDDALYLVDGGAIKQWGVGSDLEYEWKSKLFRTGEFHNFACGAVVADDEVTFKLYADTVLKHTQTVADEEMFRLPSGYRAREWEFDLTGSVDVDSVAIGQHSGELF